MKGKVMRKEYSSMTDKELVDLVINNNKEAILYLLYDRYYKDLKYFAWKYNCLDYLDELINHLYLHLRGNDLEWRRLKNFQWKSSFRTYLSSIASDQFLKYRKKMIDSIISNVNKGDHGNSNDPIDDPDNDIRKVWVMEAIFMLKNDEYRLILIKELEGYNHKEIAKMIEEKRKRENKVKHYGGEITTPNAAYVDQAKAKALKEVIIYVEQIKKEWYGNK